MDEQDGVKHVAKLLLSIVAFSSDVETEWLPSDRVEGTLVELLERHLPEIAWTAGQ